MPSAWGLRDGGDDEGNRLCWDRQSVITWRSISAAVILLVTWSHERVWSHTWSWVRCRDACPPCRRRELPRHGGIGVSAWTAVTGTGFMDVDHIDSRLQAADLVDNGGWNAVSGWRHWGVVEPFVSV